MRRLITFWEVEVFQKKFGRWRGTGYVTFDPQMGEGIISRLHKEDREGCEIRNLLTDKKRLKPPREPHEYRLTKKAGTCPHCHQEIYQRHLKISS